MGELLVLALDFGTQSIRASLINKKGDIVGIVKNPYDPPYFSNKKGYAEQHADFYWEYAKTALKQLTSKHPEEVKNIAAATVTAFRDTAVQLDKDYKPLLN